MTFYTCDFIERFIWILDHPLQFSTALFRWVFSMVSPSPHFLCFEVAKIDNMLLARVVYIYAGQLKELSKSIFGKRCMHSDDFLL